MQKHLSTEISNHRMRRPTTEYIHTYPASDDARHRRLTLCTNRRHRHHHHVQICVPRIA